jgi:hypothetical protein
MGKKKSAYKVLVEGKRPLGIPRCRWEDNINIYLKELLSAH